MAHTSDGPLSLGLFAQELSIPAGLNCGAVVGKGASNIRWIVKKAGGVKLAVGHGVVTIHARDATTLARAGKLLQDQFTAAVAYGKLTVAVLNIGATGHDKLGGSCGGVTEQAPAWQADDDAGTL